MACKLMKKIVLMFLVSISVILLASCAAESEAPAQAPEKEKKYDGYSAQQMYLIIAGRRKELSSVYSEKIFEIKVTEQGGLYEETFHTMMKDYITKLQVMTRMAEDEKISLSSAQKKEAEDKAAAFVSELSSSGCTCEISPENAAEIIEDEYTVRLLMDKILEEEDVEVSESEARVIDIVRIVLGNSDDAYACLKEISDGGEFNLIARRNSMDSEVELKVGKGDLDEPIEKAVFELEDGEVSPVIQSRGRYYIVKVVNGYDEEATAVRKERIAKERQSEAVGRRYQTYFDSAPFEIDGEVWDEAVRMTEENPEVPDIFDYTIE